MNDVRDPGDPPSRARPESRQQQREARQKARAIDKENDEKRGEKDKKSGDKNDKKSGDKGDKKRGKGKNGGDAERAGGERQRPAAERKGAPERKKTNRQSSSSAVVDRAIPRVLPFVVMKRIDPRFPSTWGHWWIEVDEEESYGWWPLPCPLGVRRLITGSRGTLNGLGATKGGTATRDPYHGDEPDHVFHPTLVVAKSDDQVRADIRAFAQSHSGGWRWNWWWLRKPTENCRSFQWKLFAAVGLVEEPQYLYTHGPGCPFMYLVRSARWRVEDAVAAAVKRGRRLVQGRQRTKLAPSEAVGRGQV